MITVNDLYIPLCVLYAELHFRFFPLFPSLLFKREPEVVFDVPYRLNPGEDLPVVLLINDINNFPAQPLKIAVTVSQIGSGTQRFDFSDLNAYKIDHPLYMSQAVYCCSIPSAEIPTGELFINATVTLQTARKQKIVFNDNFPGSSRRAFRCFRSDNYLPGNHLCDYGDLHVHSHFSQSPVEFGAPLAIIDTMAKSCGLSFVGIADHSYDLSCKISNYLEEDPVLERWQHLKKVLDNPDSFSTLLIPGEELSCLNSNGATIHLVALGHQDFLPGSSDGARRHRIHTDQLSIGQALHAIHQQNGIAFAAHPGSRTSFLQRIFLHRGNWSKKDFTTPLDGFQALNSGFKRSWDVGKKLWIELLKQGLHIPLLAGNDAHGDFSRYRAIKTPFLSIYENFQRYMGYGKTGIYGKGTSCHSIFHRIKQGTTFVTSGPYLSINLSENPHDHAVNSNTKSIFDIRNLHVHAISTGEFGQLRKISLIQGTCNTSVKNEKNLLTTIPQRYSFDLTIPIDVSSVFGNSYLRAEIESETTDGTVYKAFTSAMFIE